MEIYKIPSCWPSTSINGIQISGNFKFNKDMLTKENLNEDKEMLNNRTKLDPTLIDFIFQSCSVRNLFTQLGKSSRETSNSALFIFQKFVKSVSEINKYDLQLLAMASILISSKVEFLLNRCMM